MTSSTFNRTRIYSAEQFRESVSEPISNNSIYLTFGKTNAWANDAAPNASNTMAITEYDVWHNMIGGKRLFGNDVSHVIKRFNWTSGNVYTAYDQTNPSLQDGNTQFYVITTDNNVYKCISNANSSVSTVEPTAINPGSITQTSDNYIWKYLYTISDSDLLRFTTNEYIPVKYLISNDGSLQWQVQSRAIRGTIYNIIVTNGGTNYTNVSNLIVTISGDGTSATATANINTSTNVVSTITMTDYGSEYSYATVTISGGGGSGATARAVISPINGHGANPLYELGGSNLMINPSLRGTESDSFKVGNDFRQIALIKDPLKPDGNVMSNLKFSYAYTLTTAGSGDYLNDEVVYQGSSLSAASFTGKILSWDTANGVAVIINSFGTPTSQSLVGANSSTSRFVSQILSREVKSYTGEMLYVNNIKPIIRSADQTEEFKIVVKF